jgi:hypothetical protein
LAPPEFLRSLEESGISTWIRQSESIFGFYFILVFHTIGMALIVGSNAVLDLRLLGALPDVPLQPMERLFPIMWTGFFVNAISGILLVIGYPTKSLTNPVFYCKLLFIAIALITMQKLKVRVFGDRSLNEMAMQANGRALAKWSLFWWIVAITAGRLLAYTYKYLQYGVPS